MENSLGFVAVFAVSGSVVFLARQLHKRLLTDFMKQIEIELSGSSEKCQMMKKKVRFADDVVEPSSNNEEYRKRHLVMMATRHDQRDGREGEEIMPLNRRVLYKGIIEYRTLKSQSSDHL